MVNPGALFVPSNLDMVLGDQHLGGTVPECWEGGYTGVLLVIRFMVANLPNPDFVVLVSTKKLVRLKY